MPITDIYIFEISIIGTGCQLLKWTKMYSFISIYLKVKNPSKIYLKWLLNIIYFRLIIYLLHL